MDDDTIRVPAGLTTEGLLGRRYLARLVDTILILLMVVIAFAMIGVIFPRALVGAGTLLPVLLFLPACVLNGALLESSAWQATIGKRIVSLRVYDSDGGRLRFSQAAARSLVKDGPFVLFGLIPGGQLLSLLWFGVHVIVLHRSPVYQAIHDRVATPG